MTWMGVKHQESSPAILVQTKLSQCSNPRHFIQSRHFFFPSRIHSAVSSLVSITNRFWHSLALYLMSHCAAGVAADEMCRRLVMTAVLISGWGSEPEHFLPLLVVCTMNVYTALRLSLTPVHFLLCAMTKTVKCVKRWWLSSIIIVITVMSIANSHWQHQHHYHYRHQLIIIIIAINSLV